jgi:predicted metal-dependent peptidase
MAEKCTEVGAVRLMMYYPFWCEMFYSMKVIEDPSIPTLQTDGWRMWVNPTYYNALALDYKITALAHETCHKMLHHCTRGLDFDPRIGNIAADIVVHNLLVKNGFKIHPSWVQPEPKYDGWTFEAVYRDLMKGAQTPQPEGGTKGNPQPGDGGQEGGEEGQDEGDSEGGQEGGDQSGQPGKGKPGQPKPGQPGKSPADAVFDAMPQEWKNAWRDVQKFKGTAAEVENFEQKIEQQVANAIQTAKSAGNAPAGIEMAMDGVRVVVTEKWYDHLARYMQTLSISEYNWARNNKRIAAMHDVVAPDNYMEALGTAVILTDASGSCYDAAVQANFAGHVNAIFGECKPRRVIVAYFDTMVHNWVEMDPGEIEFEPQPQGGGGTSFVQPLEWVKEQDFNPAVVIVLTDMYGTFPQDEPDFPVVWASTEKNMKAPFGEYIEIN